MKLSLRVWPERLIDDVEFARLRELLLPHRSEIDELALILVDSLSADMPVSKVADRCAIFAPRMATLAADGFVVGINDIVLGHCDDPRVDEEDVFDGPPMVGHDGAVARGSLCPRSAATLDYLTERYTTIASLGPRFIWLDDDLRMHHHSPAEYPCFCRVCVRSFNEQHRHDFTRESLVEQLDSPGGAALRQEWVDFNARAIERVGAEIAGAVGRVDSTIELGLMTVPVRMYSGTGAPLDRWMKAMGARRGRPGAGFYTDRTPAALVEKSVAVAGQLARYPDDVVDVQYELETYPQQRGLKSVRMLSTECAAMVANGVNGIAAHILKSERGRMGEHADWVAALAAAKGLWTTIETIAGGWPNRGVHPADSPRFYSQRPVDAGGWFGDRPLSSPLILPEIGVPFAQTESESCAVVVGHEAVAGHSEEEMRRMLGRGVLMDVGALAAFTAAGLGVHCGARIVDTYSGGVMERFTDHELNGQDRGAERNTRFAGHERAHALDVIPGSRAEIVAELVTYNRRRLGAAGIVGENSLGGRVAVFGYSPWRYLHSQAKRSQVLAVLDWVARGELPILLPDRPGVIPYVRSPSDRSAVLFLLVNGSLDATGEFDVRVRGLFGAMAEVKQDGSRTRLPASRVRVEGGDTVVRMRDIGPWDFAVYTSVAD